MERVADYLEKLGFTVEEQGTIAKYLIIFKAGMPIGFILADYTVSLVSNEDETEIKKVINFVNDNSYLELVGGSEYLLATFIANKITTYYDVTQKAICYVCYLVDENGCVNTQKFYDKNMALLNFVKKTKMLNPDDIKKNGVSFKDSMLNKLISYLMSKQTR